MIGESLARILVAAGTEVMVIEVDHTRAQRLAASLPAVTVVSGDGTDVTLLQEVKVGNYGLFVAVTEEDEVNLMAGPPGPPHRRGAHGLVGPPTRTTARSTANSASTSCCPRAPWPASTCSGTAARHELQSLTVIEDGKAEILELVAHDGLPGRRHRGPSTAHSTGGHPRRHPQGRPAWSSPPARTASPRATPSSCSPRPPCAAPASPACSVGRSTLMAGSHRQSADRHAAQSRDRHRDGGRDAGHPRTTFAAPRRRASTRVACSPSAS